MVENTAASLRAWYFLTTADELLWTIQLSSACTAAMKPWGKGTSAPVPWRSLHECPPRTHCKMQLDRIGSLVGCSFQRSGSSSPSSKVDLNSGLGFDKDTHLVFLVGGKARQMRTRKKKCCSLLFAW